VTIEQTTRAATSADQAEWAPFGYRIGDFVSFRVQRPPWWRPMARWLWRRDRKRNAGVFRIVSVSGDVKLTIHKDGTAHFS